MGAKYKVAGSTILQILTVMLGFYSIGANVNLTAIDGFFDKHVFECNKPVTFRCSVPPNSAIVQWFVGNTTATKLDVNCGGNVCGNSSNFPERYIYTIDQSTGISILKITNATFEDDYLTYQCSDGSESASYNTTTILAPPKNDTIDVNIDFTTPDKVTANLTTNCIYPFQDLVVVWFSTPVDVNETQIYSVSHKQVPCSPSPACSRANTSFESVLPINITKTGQERVFYVNISFGSMHISRIVGKYNVTEAYSSSTVSTAGNTTNPTITSTKLTTPSLTTGLSATTSNNTSATPLSSETTPPAIPKNATESIADRNRNIKVLIYVGVAVGGFIVVVILFYIFCLIYQYRRRHLNNLVL